MELSGVTCRRGRRTVLQSVDVSIERGELVFLTGPNAAGKTTLLELIHGDVPPTSGAIRVDGFRLHRRWRRSLHRLRRRVAAVSRQTSPLHH